MTTLLFTYDKVVPLSYGEAFQRAGALLRQEGFDIQHLNLRRLVETYFSPGDLFLSDQFLHEEAAKIKPDFIISHHESLRLSLQEASAYTIESSSLGLVQEEIDRFFIKNYLGRIQTDTPLRAPGSLELKEEFILRMRREGLPIPQTVLRESLPEEQWTYETVREILGCNQFYLKERGKHFGQGVHYVESDQPKLFGKESMVMAQKPIRNAGKYPCVIRAVTTPGRILGALLCYNTVHDTKAFSAEGGTNMFPLQIPGQKRYLATSTLPSFLEGNGVERDLTLRDDIERLCEQLSALPSRSFIRGLDIVVDAATRRPYVLEAQTGPGNLRGRQFPLIAGLQIEPPKPQLSVSLASAVLAAELERYFMRN